MAKVLASLWPIWAILIHLVASASICNYIDVNLDINWSRWAWTEILNLNVFWESRLPIWSCFTTTAGSPSAYPHQYLYPIYDTGVSIDQHPISLQFPMGVVLSLIICHSYHKSTGNSKLSITSMYLDYDNIIIVILPVMTPFLHVLINLSRSLRFLYQCLVK